MRRVVDYLPSRPAMRLSTTDGSASVDAEAEVGRVLLGGLAQGGRMFFPDRRLGQVGKELDADGAGAGGLLFRLAGVEVNAIRAMAEPGRPGMANRTPPGPG